MELCKALVLSLLGFGVCPVGRKEGKESPPCDLLERSPVVAWRRGPGRL